MKDTHLSRCGTVPHQFHLLLIRPPFQQHLAAPQFSLLTSNVVGQTVTTSYIYANAIHSRDGILLPVSSVKKINLEAGILHSFRNP